jgi:hypothetical protein
MQLDELTSVNAPSWVEWLFIAVFFLGSLFLGR